MAVNAEFNWWLLIVGLVVGAGLVWFVVADSRRREHDIEADELPREALWLATVMEREGLPVVLQGAILLPRRSRPRRSTACCSSTGSISRARPPTTRRLRNRP